MLESQTKMDTDHGFIEVRQPHIVSVRSLVEFVLQLETFFCDLITPYLEAARRALGCFIIATNDLDAIRLPASAKLENYKDQGVSVERGFRFLKDPLFFAHSLFLKKPERLMALLIVMGLSLLIYSLAERKLRQALQEMKATIPDQRRKPTQKPIIRWVFQLLDGLDILLIRQNDQVVSRTLLNLRPVQQQVITLLGPKVENCYLSGS